MCGSGGGNLPLSVKSCINTWKKNLPDWEIIQWNETNFDVKKYPWVREALADKKYAFASDFIRLMVLEEYGGAYADTDVEVCRNIEPLLDHSFVASFDNHRSQSNDIDVTVR